MEFFLKITGGLFICLSCSLIGVHFSRKESYRINDLNELKKALLILSSEIEFASSTLPEAFINISGRMGGGAKSFFEKMAARIKEQNGEELFLIWQEELYSSFKNTYLIAEDFQVIERLGKIIGYLDKPLQLNNISMALSYIDGKNSELYVKSEKNRRLYRSIGILGGLLITVTIL